MHSSRISLEAKQGERIFVNAAKSAELTLEQECGQGVSSNTAGGCPVIGGHAGELRDADCPVISEDFDLRCVLPSASTASSSYMASQRPSPSLETARDASHIPAAAEEHPSQRRTETDFWMYPSEQIFFNAMKRKDWQPKSEDVQAVVSIHNAVYERAWSEVLKWEQLHCNKCKDPKLRKFQSRPRDFSPKARLFNLLGYKLPFDRHDWVVSRCGKDVRYVVDFYNAAPSPSMPMALHLDVRPALDSVDALLDRLKVHIQRSSGLKQLRRHQQFK